MNVPKTLAIDYGTVRIGLAMSFGTLAQPFKIISNSKDVLANLKTIIDEEEIEQVVVGISENEMAQKTHEFIAKLKKHIKEPITTTDETLSSHAVHAKLKTAKKSKRSGHIDHYAAAEFLQVWLDEYQTDGK